jgi:tetratricopeptide (TPR) repeat protein
MAESLDPDRSRRAVLHYKPEADFKSVVKKTEERAKDPEAPVEERVQSLMITAGVDVAEKRFDVALAKNQKVLAHYQQTKQRQNESVVRNNIGDIYYLQGQFPEAQKHYETAVTIAVDEKSQSLVLYQSMNLGNALFMQQKYDEALVYYDSAEKLAEANKVLVQRIPAIERIGETKAAQEKYDEAVEVLEKGCDLCREEKYQLGLKRLLERLADVFEKKGDDDRRSKTLEELEQVKAELAEIDPHYATA